MLNKFFLLLALTLSLVSFVFSQTSAPKEASDILKNIQMDISSPEDVIRELGKPSDDET